MIREADPDDRPAVRRLQALLAAPSPSLLDAALDAGAGTLLVAVPDAAGAPVGFTLGFPGDPDAEPSAVTLAELVVAPSARRRGWGRSLVDGLSARAADYDRLRLTACAGDDRALSFYRDCGFRRAGRRPDHFGDADGVLLVRDLP